MNKLLDFYRNSNQFVNDAYDRVIVEIHLKKQASGFKSFMFSGCEAGVGTTTLAISVAISMALSGWRTVLLDGDMRKGNQYKRLNYDIEVGLSDFLTDEESYENIVYETNHENLHYIPGGYGAVNPVSLLCSSKTDELMRQLSKEYDYVIIDMPSVTSSVDANILAGKVDSTVLVAAHANTNKKSVRKAKEVLSKSGSNIMGIIVNKVEPSDYKHIMKDFNYFKNKKFMKRVPKLYREL